MKHQSLFVTYVAERVFVNSKSAGLPHGVEFLTGRKCVRLGVPYWFKNVNAKIEVKSLTGTVENLNGKVWTPWPDKFLNGKGAVAWMRSNSAGRRHFGFAQVALCTWADDKTSDKSENSTWFNSSVWTVGNYWTVPCEFLQSEKNLSGTLILNVV